MSHIFQFPYSNSIKVLLSYTELKNNFIIFGYFDQLNEIIELKNGLYQGIVSYQAYNSIDNNPSEDGYTICCGSYGCGGDNYIVPVKPFMFLIFDKRVISCFSDVHLNKSLSFISFNEYKFSSSLARRYKNVIRTFYIYTDLPEEIYSLIFSFLEYWN